MPTHSICRLRILDVGDPRLPRHADPLHLRREALALDGPRVHRARTGGRRRVLVRLVERVLQQADVRRLQRAERGPQLPLLHAQARALDAVAPPHVEHDGDAGAGARLPAPHAQAFVDGVQQAQVLVDAVAVAPAQVEDVERGVQQEGELEVGARLLRVRGEEGDVQWVVLGFRSGQLRGKIRSGRVWRVSRRGGGDSFPTCLPMMPMQAMDGTEALSLAIVASSCVAWQYGYSTDRRCKEDLRL